MIHRRIFCPYFDQDLYKFYTSSFIMFIMFIDSCVMLLLSLLNVHKLTLVSVNWNGYFILIRKLIDFDIYFILLFYSLYMT